ncbi:MAG: 50S ribosomal protein L32 [Gracilibacteraceae bacterium]|jgi:large subunit ribosomal protein L32|nr:50S ribosomal protein L32 [Gracilibacteraceae bacterium]
MGVHQNRQSKARVRRRRAADKAFSPSLTECPQCHKFRLQHQLCPHCGFYNGKQVIQVGE